MSNFNTKGFNERTDMSTKVVLIMTALTTCAFLLMNAVCVVVGIRAANMTLVLVSCVFLLYNSLRLVDQVKYRRRFK